MGFKPLLSDATTQTIAQIVQKLLLVKIWDHSHRSNHYNNSDVSLALNGGVVFQVVAVTEGRRGSKFMNDLLNRFPFWPVWHSFH